MERTLRRVSRSWSDLASLMNSVLSSTPLPSASTALNISRRTLLQRKQGQRRNGVLDLQAVLLAANQAIRFVCQGHDWGRAFDGNGFGQNQLRLRPAIARAAGLSSPLSLPSTMPDLAQFQSIWPAGMDIPLDGVFAPILTPRRIGRPHTRDAHLVGRQPQEDVPWMERLRPRRSGSFVFPTQSDTGAVSSSESLESVPAEPWQAVSLSPPALPNPHRTPCRRARPLAAARPSAPR